MNIKKTFSVITASLLMSGLIPVQVFSAQASFEPYQQTFVVTAYYSPLPGQQYYVTGSYERDKILNGNGTHGASGTPVFEGMLAGPKTYAFGTQLQCGDIVTGTIADRGGAIVPKGESYSRFGVHAYDRLDIWAGHGDEGLKRALAWGKRTITCTVYPPGYSQFQQFVNLPAAQFSTIAKQYQRFLKTPSGTTGNTAAVSTHYQDIFRQLGYDPDSKAHRIAFQLRHGIIANAEETVAGNVGPQTKSMLDRISKGLKQVSLSEGLKEGDVSSQVRQLQEILVAKGYLEAKPTAIFGPQTKDALIAFQLDHGLIESADHSAAGYVGPSTLAELISSEPSEYALSDDDQQVIAQLTLADRQADSIAKADALNELAPVEEAPVSEDQFREALEALSQEWIHEHTPSEGVQAEQAEIVLAHVVDKASIDAVKAKLEPLFNPFQAHLRLGSSHDDVVKLQQFLQANGYYQGQEITNYFGVETKKAVRQFQIDQGIVDSIYSAGAGIVGPKTLQALNDLYIQQAYSLPQEVSDSIRAPAVHPEDLKLQQASTDTTASL